MNNVAVIDDIQTNRSLKPEDHAIGFSAGNGVQLLYVTWGYFAYGEFETAVKAECGSSQRKYCC